MIATENTTLSNAISINQNILSPEVYVSEDIDIHALEMTFVNEAPLTNVKVVPNPFSAKADIEFNLKSAGQISLSIFDPSGLQYYKTSQYFPKGKNSFKINTDEIPSSGILFYTLESNGVTRVGKIIRTD